MLSRLIPRDEQFFDLFNQLAQHLKSSASEGIEEGVQSLMQQATTYLARSVAGGGLTPCLSA